MLENEILIGILPLNEAKRIQSELKKLHILSQLKSNPATCSSGSCSVTVELWAENNEEVILNFLKEEQQKNLKGIKVNYDLLNEVYDESEKFTNCQACGETFETNLLECPECGLVY